MAEMDQEQELSHSVLMGSQDVYDLFCQPCDTDDNHVEAAFYCNNCAEYMCRKCSKSHKTFKQMSNHDILDIKQMTRKPPVSKDRSTPSPVPGKSDISTSTNPANALASTNTVTIATHIKDIHVEGAGNIISSTLMYTDKLLVADDVHNKVLLVDICSGTRVSEMKLSGRPWQVTRVGDTEAAVTIPADKKIAMLRTEPGLSLVREISTHGECRGIAYMDNKYIVTFKEGSVDIIDMSRSALTTISTDQKGERLFIAPCFVTTNPATRHIYVTDWLGWGAGSVMKLSLKGRVNATYSSSYKYGYLHQAALDSQGMVYVACKRLEYEPEDSWRVFQLNDKCGKVKTIIRDRSSEPRALSFDETTQQLYVGQYDGVVKVYRLS